MSRFMRKGNKSVRSYKHAHNHLCPTWPSATAVAQSYTFINKKQNKNMFEDFKLRMSMNMGIFPFHSNIQIQFLNLNIRFFILFNSSSMFSNPDL